MGKALLIVDMVNDFVNPDGGLPVQGAPTLVDNIKKLKSVAPLTIYANDAHEKDDKEFANWPPHSIKGTYGAQVVEGLTPNENDLIIEKQELGVFTNSRADALIRAKGIDEILITGVATEYCVRAAALGAKERGYKVNIVVDAIAGVDEIILPDGKIVPGTKGAVSNALIEMGNKEIVPMYAEKALEYLVK